MSAFTLDQESKLYRNTILQERRTHKHFFQSSNAVPHNTTLQHGNEAILFCFLRQTGGVPLRAFTCRSEVTGSQAFPRPSNASRGPGLYSANIPNRETPPHAACAGRDRAFGRSVIRYRPYETLRSLASLSTVSRTV